MAANTLIAILPEEPYYASKSHTPKNLRSNAHPAIDPNSCLRLLFFKMSKPGFPNEISKILIISDLYLFLIQMVFCKQMKLRTKKAHKMQTF